jgi:hypothetical protein
LLADDLGRAANARRNDGPLLTVKAASNRVAGLGGDGAIAFYRESAGSSDEFVVFRRAPGACARK